MRSILCFNYFLKVITTTISENSIILYHYNVIQLITGILCDGLLRTEKPKLKLNTMSTPDAPGHCGNVIPECEYETKQ